MKIIWWYIQYHLFFLPHFYSPALTLYKHYLDNKNASFLDIDLPRNDYAATIKIYDEHNDLKFEIVNDDLSPNLSYLLEHLLILAIFIYAAVDFSSLINYRNNALVISNY